MPTNDGDYIRSLIEEARTMETKPLPGAGSTARNLWNFPSLPHAMVRLAYYGQDSEKEWESDQRRAHVLKRLSATHPGGEGLPAGRLRNEVSRYSSGELGDIDSPYHKRGIFTAGAPLHNIVTYMGSFPSMAYNASAMAANSLNPEAPFDPDAKKNFDSSLNTAGAYLPEYFGMVPKGTRTYADAANDAAEARGTAVPWYETEPKRQERYAEIAEGADREIGEMYTDGTEHYMRQGMPKIPALFLGALSDSMLDPYGGWVAAGRVARQGQAAKAARELAKEWGIGQAFATGAAANEATR